MTERMETTPNETEEKQDLMEVLYTVSRGFALYDALVSGDHETAASILNTSR